MRKLLLAILISGSTSLLAMTPSEFYLDLLRRGVAEVDAGRHANAPDLLRLAAFGLVDSIEHYQIAQVYLAVAADKLGEQDRAREAALRVVAADKIERRYASLRLSTPARSAFEAVARKVLPSADVAALNAPIPAAAIPVPVTTPPVVDGGLKPAAPQSQPQPQTSTTATVAPPTPVKVAPPPPPPPAKKPAAEAAAVPQVTPAPVKPAVNVAAQLAAGERALVSANLGEAKRIYRELLALQSLDRSTIIRVGEGLYRARDFAPALQAFRRLGALRGGEEAYRYYIAVALYETGDYASAKRELDAALPHIEITPDVQRYRVKIDAAR